MEIIQAMNWIVSAIFFICYFYQFLYLLVPFIKKEKPCENVTLHKFAVLISARNEAAVIAQLIQSIKDQSYPSNLVDVFVMADNCTDNTADIARAAGAIVFERENKEQVGKGYALDCLYNKIMENYPPNEYDGFFVFDADNVLDEHYIEEMNKTFSQGYRIITSYRNSKNYDSNWLSAGYALWFLRESKYLNNARMLLGTSCAVSGTGFLFHRNIIKKTGGWKFFLLTEDIQFTVHNILDGETIGYCKSAIIYDEQPIKFRQSWSQRMRWAKGFLQVFRHYGARLIKSIVAKKSFACLDMVMIIMPAIFLTALTTTVNLGYAVYVALLGNNAMELFLFVFFTVFKMYMLLYIVGLITTITEWNQINCPGYKKILYTFTFPVFMFTYVPISVVALFKDVKWDHIEHVQSKSVHEIRNMN